MEWTVRLVRRGDKGPVTLQETTYPSRAKAAQSMKGYTRNIVRDHEKSLYIVAVDK